LIPVFLGDRFILIGEMNDPTFIRIPVNDIVRRRPARPATRGSLRNDIQAQLDLKIPQRLHGLLLSHA
jgi:hypothetical protein